MTRAQADRTPFDAWARTVAYEGRWKGPTVQVPTAQSRPATASLPLRSDNAPVAVHAEPGVSQSQAVAALTALENAYWGLRERGFALPRGDGGLGGTAGFDVYLAFDARDVEIGYDGPDLLSAYDGALVFGRADPLLPERDLDACMANLLVEAGLLSLDPAESSTLRKATAAYASYLVTGQFGCRADDQSMQVEAYRGLLHDHAMSATALFFAILSERQDGGTGGFLQEMWQFARQDSRQIVTLRASPDVWEATTRALANAHEDAEDLIVDFSVARYFAGPKERSENAAYATLRNLNIDQAVPLFAHVDAEKLPRHVYGDHDLLPYGSAYAEVNGENLRDGDELRVWLRGDPDARWSLVAVRLSESGKELGRVVAPAASKPGAFLPLLWTEGTRRVVLVVTCLPKTTLDVDNRVFHAAGFKLMLDRIGSAPP